MIISFKKLAKISLVLVYLVIVAGAVVRMTGSGMGCPDWPKCFGYYIPPTEEKTLQWESNRDFKKGQVIIKDEGLLIAKKDFNTKDSFNPENWNTYTKHDYAIFNVWHTWIEYINRLLGALAGLATLLLAFYSFKFWRTQKKITLFAWIVVFGMGFQAWLGATVVYSVLEPVKITLHMVMALVIVALLIYLIHLTKPIKESLHVPQLRIFLVGALLLTLVQIILGTQVRQFVDEQIDLVGENAKNLWLQDPTLQFYVHRSLSIMVLLVNGYIWWLMKKKQINLAQINWIMAIIGLEVLTGISMYYIDFPFGSQPAHLVLASVLFGFQFSLVLNALSSKTTIKTY
ncbi:COX15/CtaA family protein [Flagellimonas meridianipacifica]|uniref:Cytochrome c oxidase assembly protein subunit 15 n=1 Tax=Flagellimonas meridianipacifica TaxID=1080225 RepID=A0A2T0M9F0_9FLAO|nr:COX15/CtaA family protein [Allomuricauda pacifica]PRX54103.1 cytochrome c oxidase assembly protein subunit 15 [Allomuricauda pacifica]